MAKVLVVDDDKLMNEMLCQAIGLLGHMAAGAGSLRQGMEMAADGDFDVIFLDVQLPDGNGLQGLSKLRAAQGEPEVIIITAVGDPDGAETAIRNGAWDYIEKPSSLEKMTFPLQRAIEYRERQRVKPVRVFHRERIVGSSPAIRACLDHLAEAAATEAGVLITGETGTGKELFARAIHDNSPRAKGPFVVVDCASIPETLLEGELFGHVRGAYTGADRDRPGLVAQAHGGALFLDEIGELPLSHQKAFLRVLQDRRFRPLGAKTESHSDFRLLAATNRDLEAMVRAGRFREDLLFRLKSFHVDLPPLRERGADIRELARVRIAELAQMYGLADKGASAEFYEALMAYPWPGNVRELNNVIERAMVAATHEPVLTPPHLPTEVRVCEARSRVGQAVEDTASQTTPEGGPGDGQAPETAPGAWAGPWPGPWKDVREAALAKLERDYLQQTLALTKGNVSVAARKAGISRARFYAMLKKHGITRQWREEDDNQNNTVYTSS